MFGAQQRPLRMDEHCQYLSVTAPADLAPGEELPVMVWIHGGSYLTGAGDSGATDPAELVAEQRVVVVTVTYRLGLLGYPGGGARGSNLGLLDQAQALRWVRRNIAAFGGNAQQVTGFGESAGGDAIAHLLLAFPDERLMDRAIIQSAPLGIMRGRGPMTAAMNALADTAAPDATLADLGHLQEVITAKVAGNSLRYGLRTGMPWGVQYAAPPLPPEEQVLDSWQDAAGIPLLIGTTAAEVTLFTEPMAVMRAMRRLPIVGVRLHDALVRRLTRAIFDDGADALARRWVAGGNGQPVPHDLVGRRQSHRQPSRPGRGPAVRPRGQLAARGGAAGLHLGRRPRRGQGAAHDLGGLRAWRRRGGPHARRRGADRVRLDGAQCHAVLTGERLRGSRSRRPDQHVIDPDAANTPAGAARRSPHPSSRPVRD